MISKGVWVSVLVCAGSILLIGCNSRPEIVEEREKSAKDEHRDEQKKKFRELMRDAIARTAQKVWEDDELWSEFSSKEPPLAYLMRVGNQSGTFREGNSLELEGSFINPEVVLSALSYRVFLYKDVLFKYPRELKFLPIILPEEGIKAWLFFGEDFSIHLNVEENSISLESYVQGEKERLEALRRKKGDTSSIPLSKASPLSFGHQELPGMALTDETAGEESKEIWSYYRVPSEIDGTVFLRIIDSPDNAGNPSPEARSALRLLQPSSESVAHDVPSSNHDSSEGVSAWSKEPPLDCNLRVGDKLVSITAGKPLRLTGTFTDVEVRLSADQHRTFRYKDISFKYSHDFDFDMDEAVLEQPSDKNWTLSSPSDEVRIDLWAYNDSRDVDDYVKEKLNSASEIGGKASSVVSARSLRFGDRKLQGKAFTVTYSQRKWLEEVYRLPSGSDESMLLVLSTSLELQDDIDDAGSGSSEASKTRMLLEQSSALKGKRRVKTLADIAEQFKYSPALGQ